ncbi:MAG: hypothetical protein COB67_04140 [SAR324 cluster bacterium]|uniref:Uncharacterized protein n=1 Tax=SAR324 cluster bacterium TaxID=2024889 RepID=A0A2A4T7B3_9DELT|nr:MAG: hypothetical protein COB67_04140 [SAR324 cluster bacterium]
MNKTELFNFLETRDCTILLDLLQVAYDEMNTTQRHMVFGELIKKMPPSVVNGSTLFKEIVFFHQESLSGYYYAPFDINSKNFSHIPEETEEWFDRLSDLLQKSMLLTKQDEHPSAVKCFKILYKLIEHMEQGDEIIFAEEYGDWMIQGDQKAFARAYLTSLAATTTPSDFTETAIPLIKNDISCVNKIYASALAVANREQKALLNKELQARRIEIKL